MTYSFQQITPSPSLWSELENAADSNCFFSLEWHNYLSGINTRHFLASVHRDGTLAGYFIGGRISIFGMKIISAPPMATGTYSQGLCMKDTVSQQERISIYQALVTWLYAEHLADYIQICDWQLRTISTEWIPDWHHPLLDNVGIHYHCRSTFYLDTRQPEETLWANLHYKSCKYAINKARKEGLYVERVEDNQEIDTFVQQHMSHLKDMLRRKKSRGLPCQRRKNITSLCHSSANPLMIRVLFKDSTGNEIAVASGIFVAGKNGSTYFTGASLEQYMRLCPNELLVWEAIRMLHAMGAGDLIFGGVAPYKRKFGTTYAYLPVMVFSRYPFLLDFRTRIKKLYQNLLTNPKH